MAIPAKNEAALIVPCLKALATQSLPADEIVLVVNNTSDDTIDLARAMADRLSSRLHIVNVDLPPSQENAGFVRGIAMTRAQALAGSRGMILTTDADSVVPANWVERNASWLEAGYDAVCGRAIIDPIDERNLPGHLVADDAAETRYGRILDEIDHWADPRHWNPWPRHREASGASIAVRAAVYTAVGGLPPLSSSEDRAFVARLEQRDCKIRYDPALRVLVSGRSVGRAEGGMAATIARRLIEQDEWADNRLERPLAAFRRAVLRRQARAVWQRAEQDVAPLAAHLQMAASTVATALKAAWFGSAWADLELSSPALTRVPILMKDLPALIAEAQPLLVEVRREAQTGRFEGGRQLLDYAGLRIE